MVKFLIALSVPILLLSNTYKINEPDVISEAENRQGRALKHMERELKDENNKIKKLKGSDLSKATKNQTYFVDMTYTLTHDIPKVDRYGKTIGILYPKGYSFNPLNYIRIAPPPIVILNACSKSEIELAKKLSANRPDAMFASAGCEIEDFPKDIGRTLYLVTDEMKKKFNLRYTLSILNVDMNSRRIKVDVYKTR